jgi:hypothetical protein
MRCHIYFTSLYTHVALRGAYYDSRYKYNDFYNRSKSEFFKGCSSCWRTWYSSYFKKNVQKYLVIDFSKAEQEKIASMEDVFAISQPLLSRIWKLILNYSCIYMLNMKS